MSPTLQELGIDRLSAEDRLSLAEAIWESVAQEAEQAPLPEGQRKELERRLADSIAHPEKRGKEDAARFGVRKVRVPNISQQL